METLEMLDLKEKGYSTKHIAEIAGVSTTAIRQRIKRYNEGIVDSRRGKKLKLNEIVFQGFYDYFKENPKESVQSFLRKLHSETTNSNNEKMRSFIKGKREAWFTVPQIKRLCEFIGKPFEEVFKEREVE